MTSSARSAVATIDDFITQIGHTKTAAQKAADGSTPLSEPGSIGGETSHPVKKVDDRLEKAKEGERSAENSKDVKEDQGAPSVENAAEASTKNAAASVFAVAGRFAKKAEGAVSTPGSAADDHISTTTTVSATGEDPKNETNKAKAGKEDKKQGNMGGTSHPASTENDQLDGHKYAADSLEKLAADMTAAGNNLLAALNVAYQGGGQAAPAAVKTAAAAAPAPAAAGLDPRLAMMVGSEMAGLMNGTADKRAVDSLVRETLVGIMKQAADDADLFTQYATDYMKRAAEEEPDPAAAGGAGGPPPGAGGPPPGGGAGGGGEEDAMMAALGGGGEAGGDPSGGMGGMGGAPGGEGGDQDAVMLAKALESLGVTQEELAAAIQEVQSGGAGGPPPGGPDPTGGMGGAPAGPPGGGGGMEATAAAGGGKRQATNKIAQDEMTKTIVEIIARSKRK